MRLTRVGIAAAIVFAAAIASPAEAKVTYVANCGSTGYLDYKPSYWSNGCTGGAFNVKVKVWQRWSGRRARGRGKTLFRDPLCRPTCPEARAYRYPARVRLRRRRVCQDDSGERRRYFSRVAVRVKYPAGNPFDEPAGWQTTRFEIPAGGPCELSP